MVPKLTYEEVKQGDEELAPDHPATIGVVFELKAGSKISHGV